MVLRQVVISRLTLLLDINEYAIRLQIVDIDYQR